MQTVVWLILFLPLAAAGVITLFTQRFSRASAQLSILAIGISFILSLALYFRLGDQPALQIPSLTWLAVGGLNVELGFVVDHLSVLMLLVVTGVGLMIHIYSFGYMQGDPGFS